MRISPLVLLLFAMVGCGSGTEPGKTPAKAVDDQAQDVPEQPAKPDAESDGNQAQPQKAVTPRFSHSPWYKDWGVVNAMKSNVHTSFHLDSPMSLLGCAIKLRGTSAEVTT